MRAQNTLRIVFDAQPLLSRQKSGVGYYTEGLIKALADLPDIELTGHYWETRGGGRPSLPASDNLRYKSSSWLSGVIYRGLRKLGLRLPIELFARGRPDIYLFTNFSRQPSWLKVPSAVVVHDLAYLDCPQFIQPKNRRFLKRYVQRDAKQAALVMCVSDFTKSRLQHYYQLPDSKILVQPIPPQPPAPESKSSIKLPADFILFMGTLEPRKNVAALVDGYLQLDDNLRAKYHLVLAGGTGWDDNLLNRIKQLQKSGEKIELTGYVDESTRAALYTKAALVAVPSVYEGFGMPVLEAMSYGKPAVISDLPVFHEVAGSAALYFDPADTAAAAEALKRVLTDERLSRSLSEKSLGRAGDYSWAKTAEAVSSRLRALI